MAGDLLNIVTRYQSLTDRYGQILLVLLPEMSRHPELVEALDRPLDLMHAIGRLLTRYQEEGILRPEIPLHTNAALLGPLIYFAMIRGTIFAGRLPPMVLEQHVIAFLDGCRR